MAVLLTDNFDRRGRGQGVAMIRQIFTCPCDECENKRNVLVLFLVMLVFGAAFIYSGFFK